MSIVNIGFYLDVTASDLEASQTCCPQFDDVPKWNISECSLFSRNLGYLQNHILIYLHSSAGNYGLSEMT